MSVELESLRIELRELGATNVQRGILEADVARARAAIALAVKRGADTPLAYALSLFHSVRFQHQPRQMPASNLHGTIDPTMTDEGERIWQWHEVDDEWRHAHLMDCVRALGESRFPDARYQPSDTEFVAFAAIMHERRETITVPIEPKPMRGKAMNALSAWAKVWSFDDLDTFEEASLEAVSASRPEEDDIPF